MFTRTMRSDGYSIITTDNNCALESNITASFEKDGVCYNTDDESIGEKLETKTGSRAEKALKFLKLFLISAIGFFVAAVCIGALTGSIEIETSTCRHPAIRREWRSLLPEEKREYIRAIKCLEAKPSTLTGRGSLYDDLVYVHMNIGSLSHDAASFLPWHRAFLHVYEQILKQVCNFQGTIPYWAWDLDWHDLQSSSIWNSEDGFGGDGDPGAQPSPGNGHCLGDGPFKDSQRTYFSVEINPHCLGRGFVRNDSDTGGVLQGEWFRPEEIGRLKRAFNFDAFRKIMEKGFHNGLHWTIGGDFSSWTAANDPIFFLHHGQLDRLWWDWQQEELDTRLTDYYGVSFNTTKGRTEMGSLDDHLQFMEMWPDIKVSEVMNAEGGILCYRYS